MEDTLFGIGIGVAVTLWVSSWMSRREHREWCVTFDRAMQLVDELQSQNKRLMAMHYCEPDDFDELWRNN